MDTATITRRRLPAPQPGFLGPGHTAVEILGARDLVATDPFVFLMDDRLDFPAGQKIGEAHPHAGLETVTLVLEGGLTDRDEGQLHAGDLVWMTAGRGVIHSEHIVASGSPTRVLQLWIRLPEHARQVPPRLDVLPAADVPVQRTPGAEALVYSGARHNVPVTLLDIDLAAGATFGHILPPDHNGFLLPIAGEIEVAQEQLAAGDIGWIHGSQLQIHAPTGARVLLYAGQRQNQPTVQRGPFVAGSPAEINQQYAAYRAGLFTPASQLGH
jgi:redox-sensitive bicupin YhaK (pirin superfamily)